MGRVRGRQAFHVRPAQFSISVEASTAFWPSVQIQGMCAEGVARISAAVQTPLHQQNSYAPGGEGYLHAGPCFPEDLVLRGGTREEGSRKN